MAEENFFSPVKIGLFLVASAYFFYALHQTFTLSWIGEWNRFFPGRFLFDIYVEDVIGFVGTVFRLVGGSIAFSALAYYLIKRTMKRESIFKALRAILVFEGIFWALSFLPTAYYSTRQLLSISLSLETFLRYFTLNNLPVLVESVVLPVFLFILAYKLNHTKPLNTCIRWGLIYGAIYVFFLWLMNTTIWISVVEEPERGWAFLTASPQYLLSFVLTVAGLLILAIYTVFFALKSRHANALEEVSFGSGVIILALGLYYMWNYLTWIYFGGWNNWFAWFLGHNEDLWILSLPMLGISLLFWHKSRKEAVPA